MTYRKTIYGTAKTAALWEWLDEKLEGEGGIESFLRSSKIHDGNGDDCLVQRPRLPMTRETVGVKNKTKHDEGTLVNVSR